MSALAFRKKSRFTVDRRENVGGVQVAMNPREAIRVGEASVACDRILFDQANRQRSLRGREARFHRIDEGLFSGPSTRDHALCLE